VQNFRTLTHKRPAEIIVLHLNHVRPARHSATSLNIKGPLVEVRIDMKHCTETCMDTLGH
jgi:hypothetical protein